MTTRNLFSTLLFISFSTFSAAQDSIPSYSFSLNGVISNKETVPFWLVYGRNGKIEGKDQLEAFATADINLPFYFGEKWKIETGLQGIARNKVDKSNLQEIYFDVSFGTLELRAGKEEYTLSQYSDDLSSGSYFLSNNASPIPRVGLGFYDYVDVPFTNGYIQVKGFLNQGILDDDRGRRGTKNPLFHEKAAYIRTNKLLFNPHVGINHSALFGGTRPDGTEIPVDYMAVFFGKGSEKVGKEFKGEETNVAGGHLGLVDFGVNFDVQNVHVQTYYQKPFKDGSGFWQFFENNRDYIFGVVAKVENGALIKEFVYESMFTLWQSGPGAHDPVVDGKIVFISEVDDYDQFIFDNFGIVVEGITDKEFAQFLERTINYGHRFGGRDNYYNNGLYYRGWSYRGKSLGTPVFLTEDRVKSFLPDFDSSHDFFFVDTRVKMHHFGISGEIASNLAYKIKYTYTRNYGTYFGLNKGGTAWESQNPASTYDYYFDEKKPQSYLLLETDYSVKSVKGLNLNVSLAYDYGSMYRSLGALIGVQYSGNFNIQKK